MNTEIRTAYDRRQTLKILLSACGLAQRALGARKETSLTDSPFFRTRGVVILPEDLTLQDWPERVQQAGLSTIALHDGLSARKVARFAHSREGLRFLEQCRKLRLNVEYELHAMSDLLPRDLFQKTPSLFRMKENGERTADANLCVHSREALEIASDHAVELSRLMRPTTGRYFLWSDDGRAWCRCRQCDALSDTDQALVVTNTLLRAIRKQDLKATMAHLAYANTLLPPKSVKPDPGVFLEFAPINRRYDISLADTKDAENRHHLEALDANLEIFEPDNAQVLEYWLDVSRFSQWKKAAQKLPFNSNVLAADLEVYGSRKIRHVTSFAAYMDADYVAKYGEPPLNSYGRELQRWRPSRIPL
jgi:uncharacterized protein DUF4838